MRRLAVSASTSLVIVLFAYALSSLGLLALPVMVVLELPVVLSYYLIGVTAAVPYLLVAWFIWGVFLYVAISVFTWIRARVLRDRQHA